MPHAAQRPDPPEQLEPPEPLELGVADRRLALRMERSAQIRALLLVALILLLFLILRARPLHLFHPGWWRI